MTAPPRKARPAEPVFPSLRLDSNAYDGDMAHEVITVGGTFEVPDDWLEDVLRRLGDARVTVFGDFCLDAYWIIDPDRSELSIETSLPVKKVRQQRYGLGGAGNVVANLVDLGVGSVRCVALVGDDMFGREMLRILQSLNVDVEGMLFGPDQWQTMVYAKPYLDGEEWHRMDYGAFNTISEASIAALSAALARAADESDVVVLNQQVPAGISSPAMIEQINAVISAHPACAFLADSRHRAGLYAGAMLKMNAHEAAAMLDGPAAAGEAIDEEHAVVFAHRLQQRVGQTVFLTRGGDGIVVADGRVVRSAPGISVAGPVDTVGAGDTVASALAGVLAVGGEPIVAAILANIAAAVTVTKLQTTGTACPDEIRAAAIH